jgi:hypothetical protein
VAPEAREAEASASGAERRLSAADEMGRTG